MKYTHSYSIMISFSALFSCLLLGLCLGCRRKKEEKQDDKKDDDENEENIDYVNSLSNPPAYSFYGMQRNTRDGQETPPGRTKKKSKKKYEEIENVYENIHIDA